MASPLHVCVCPASCISYEQVLYILFILVTLSHWQWRAHGGRAQWFNFVDIQFPVVSSSQARLTRKSPLKPHIHLISDEYGWISQRHRLRDAFMYAFPLRDVFSLPDNQSCDLNSHLISANQTMCPAQKIPAPQQGTGDVSCSAGVTVATSSMPTCCFGTVGFDRDKLSLVSKCFGFWWPSVPDTVPGSTQSGKLATTPWSDPNNTARHHGNHPGAHGHTSVKAFHNFPVTLTQILITFTHFPAVRGVRCSLSNTLPPFQDAKISPLLCCLLSLSVVSFQ